MKLRPACACRSVALALAVAMGVTGCGGGENTGSSSASAPPAGLTPEQASRVVARVGDKTITLGDYAAALERMDPFDRVRYQTTERRRELLKELVDLELLAAEAKRRGLDKKPVAQEALRQILRDALLDEVHKGLPTPTEIPVGEVREYYDANIDEFREPGRRRLTAIIVTDGAKAKEVLAAFVADPQPNTWGKLFFESSITAQEEKKRRVPLDLAGELGMVGPPGDAKGGHPKVPEPVRAAGYKIEKTGEVFPEPVEADGKFYIVRMTGRVPAHERTFAEAEPQIRQVLLKKRIKEMDQNLEAELRKKYKIEVDEAALGAVVVPSASPEEPVLAPTRMNPSALPPPSPSSSAAPAPSASSSAKP